MKRAILAALLLAGCAHKPVEPVRIMVPTPCIVDRPEKPVIPEIAENAGLFDRVKALLIERERRIAYEGEMEAALSACD